MTEIDAYMQLLFMAGVILSLPFVWHVFSALGKLFIINFFPPKYINIEIQDEQGKKHIRKVVIANNQELIDALSQATGRIIQ
jgi:hypothetical protein